MNLKIICDKKFKIFLHSYTIFNFYIIWFPFLKQITNFLQLEFYSNFNYIIKNVFSIWKLFTLFSIYHYWLYFNYFIIKIFNRFCINKSFHSEFMYSLLKYFSLNILHTFKKINNCHKLHLITNRRLLIQLIYLVIL